MKHTICLRLLFAITLLMFPVVVHAQGVAQSPTTQSASQAAREVLSLDRGWRFFLGDVPFPLISGQNASYNNAKAGTAGGAAAPDFDDSDWRKLDLPHDWAVEGPFDPAANLSQGYRQRGIGWYRKVFRVEPSDRGKNIEIQFDGISTNAKVWFNGTIVAHNWCGYTSFKVDVTSMMHYGDNLNTVAVRVDADQQEGWWYEGAGMYRHTWLVKRSPVFIETDGVYANPVRGADGAWSVPVEVSLNSSDKSSAKVEVESVLIDPDGKEIARSSSQSEVVPFQSSVARSAMTVGTPRLWSVDEPVMYSVRTTLKRDGKAIDEVTTTCGFRTIRFDAATGFYLNDKHLKLKGVCNHQDHAGVGVAVPDSIWDFRIRKLKEMGVNAYRCAHNPPAKEFLDACDRMGLLVMDETRHFNTAPEYVAQLEWMVRRDRNHPSVILWSVFNEEPTQGTEQGYEMVRLMAAKVKALDVTRPVTAAQSNSMLNAVNASQAADVAGFNYRHNEYDRYHELNPNKAITSSEDTSAVMTRGVFVTDRRRQLLDSYDTQWQSWGLSHREAWKQIDTRPFLAGGFAWTGFDYRGETQPLAWPATGSSFGIMDLCGFPKSAFYMHQAMWIDDKPILRLEPHWNWEDSEGKTIKVMAISNADRVRLTLNGQAIGEKPSNKYDMVMFDVPYTAGKLEAVGFKGEKEVSRFAVETTGMPVKIEVIPDRSRMNGDGRDAVPITVRMLDAEGRPVPTANHKIKFELVGPGRIIGLNNGDPTCHEPEKGDRHSLFNGLAQVIVQSDYATSGKLVLKATIDHGDPTTQPATQPTTRPGTENSENIVGSECSIDVMDVPQPPDMLPARPTLMVERWRMSPVTKERPDPNMVVSRNDMNTWGAVQPGRLSPFEGGTFAVFRTTFRPRPIQRRNGGLIILKDVVGKAQVYLNGNLVAERQTSERETMTVPMAPGTTDRTISVLIEAPAGSQAGLGGVVTVE